MDTEPEVLEPSVKEEVKKEVVSEDLSNDPIVKSSEETETKTEPEPRVIEEIPPVEPAEPPKETPVIETEEFKKLQSDADKRVSEAEDKVIKSDLEREWVEATRYAEQQRTLAQQSADRGEIDQTQADAHKQRFSEQSLRQSWQQYHNQQQADKERQADKQEHEGYLRYNNAFKVALKYKDDGVEFNDIFMDESLKTEDQMKVKALEIVYSKTKNANIKEQAPVETYKQPPPSDFGANDDKAFLKRVREKITLTSEDLTRLGKIDDNYSDEPIIK